MKWAQSIVCHFCSSPAECSRSAVSIEAGVSSVCVQMVLLVAEQQKVGPHLDHLKT